MNLQRLHHTDRRKRAYFGEDWHSIEQFSDLRLVSNFGNLPYFADHVGHFSSSAIQPVAFLLFFPSKSSLDSKHRNFKFELKSYSVKLNLGF